MTAVKIIPVKMMTIGGHEAVIDAINPSSHDIFVGKLNNAAGTMDARWDKSGLCRGGTDGANIDATGAEFRDLLKHARNLGAKV